MLSFLAVHFLLRFNEVRFLQQGFFIFLQRCAGLCLGHAALLHHLECLAQSSDLCEVFASNIIVRSHVRPVSALLDGVQQPLFRLLLVLKGCLPLLFDKLFNLIRGARGCFLQTGLDCLLELQKQLLKVMHLPCWLWQYDPVLPWQPALPRPSSAP